MAIAALVRASIGLIAHVRFAPKHPWTLVHLVAPTCPCNPLQPRWCCYNPQGQGMILSCRPGFLQADLAAIPSELPQFPLSGVFWVVWALYTGRHTYVKLTRSLRGVKGSLRGGVLFIFVWGCLRGWWRESYFVSKFEEVSFEATFAWPFVASFACIWPFVASVSFHFGLLWLHFLSFWPKCLVCIAKGSMAASFIPPKIWGPTCMAGAISCLRWAYAEVTQRLRGGSW